MNDFPTRPNDLESGLNAACPTSLAAAAASDSAAAHQPRAESAPPPVPAAAGEGGPPASIRPEGFRRVAALLADRGHPHRPLFLEVAARTAQEAAEALGVTTGQIAKSVVFRRRQDDAPVLVVTSGDRRVDEAKVAAIVGSPLGRADAAFVKSRTGFSIGGVAPLGHAVEPVTLIDSELFRFDAIWAAAGHPNGVFRLSPLQLIALTGAPVVDVVQAVPADDRAAAPG